MGVLLLSPWRPEYWIFGAGGRGLKVNNKLHQYSRLFSVNLTFSSSGDTVGKINNKNRNIGVKGFMHTLKHKKVELFWFLVAFSGCAALFLSEYLLDSQENPPFLTHVSTFFGLGTSLLFLFENNFTNKVLRRYLFVAWPIAVCVAVGRSYLDFDRQGSWIIYFQSVKASFASAEMYRTWDFLGHYLPPLGYIHVSFCNLKRLNDIFEKDTRKNIFFSWFFAVLVLSIWYASVRYLGYSLKDLYLIQGEHIYFVAPLLFLAPIVATIPVHACLSKVRVPLFEKLLSQTIILSCFLIISLSAFSYRSHLLMDNLMFSSSLLIFIFFFMRSVGLINSIAFHRIFSVLVCISIFSFMISEAHFASAGGGEGVYLSSLNPEYLGSHVIYAHYMIKILFYLCIILMPYTYNSFVVWENLGGSRQGISQKHMLLACIIGGALFLIYWALGVFARYDIKNTGHDIFYFFFALLFSIELAVPVRVRRQAQ